MSDTTKALVFVPDSSLFSNAIKRALMTYLKERELIPGDCTILTFKKHVISSPSKTFNLESRDLISSVKNTILEMINNSELFTKGGKNISLYYMPVSNPIISTMFGIQLQQMVYKSEQTADKKISIYSPILKHQENKTEVTNVISFSEASYAGLHLRSMSQPLRVFLYASTKDSHNFIYDEDGLVSRAEEMEHNKGKTPDEKDDVIYFDLPQGSTAVAYNSKIDTLVFAPRREGNKKIKPKTIRDFKQLSLKSPELASELFDIPVNVIKFIIKETA